MSREALAACSRPGAGAVRARGAPANAPARKRRTFMGRCISAALMPACRCGPRLAKGARGLRLPC